MVPWLLKVLHIIMVPMQSMFCLPQKFMIDSVAPYFTELLGHSSDQWVFVYFYTPHKG